MTGETLKSGEVLPAPPKRRRWVTVLLALLVFGAGMASGSALTISVIVHRLQYVFKHPEGMPGRIVARLENRLGLDETQKTKVEAIVAKRQAAMMDLRREFEPHLMEQLDLLRAEIGELLTEAQRAKWERMFDDLRKRWLPEGVGGTPEAKQ